MNIALNPEATDDKSREIYRKTSGQFEAVTLDTAFPQAARELAQMSVAHTREAYERSKTALEAAVDTMTRSFDALGQGAAALNRKIIEIAQQNANSGFDLGLPGKQHRVYLQLSPREFNCSRRMHVAKSAATQSGLRAACTGFGHRSGNECSRPLG